MSDPSHHVRRLFQRLLLRDTLDQLFRCGACGASLLGALGFGLVRDGQLHEVPCPHCNQVWAFARVPEDLYANELLTRAQLADPFATPPDPGDHHHGPA